MSSVTIDLVKTVVFFGGVLLCLELGRRHGARRMRRDPEGGALGLGSIEGAVFALLGLLVAFTFSGAADRFDERRRQIVDETNAIGTAYLRLDLLHPDHRDALRERFRLYLDKRLEAYGALPDVDRAFELLDEANDMQQQIWQEAVIATRETDSASTEMLLLPALNTMFDITTTRTMAAKFHPPRVIYSMLFAVALVASFLAGEGMAGARHRCLSHTLGFAAIMAITIFVILDLEQPRLGLVRVNAFDEALVNLRASMK